MWDVGRYLRKTEHPVRQAKEHVSFVDCVVRRLISQKSAEGQSNYAPIVNFWQYTHRLLYPAFVFTVRSTAETITELLSSRITARIANVDNVWFSREFPNSSPDMPIPVPIARDTQAILDLPTVERGSRGRWAGLRRQQPWSESVDGEEFVESLLLVVLRARVRKPPSEDPALLHTVLMWCNDLVRTMDVVCSHLNKPTA